MTERSEKFAFVETATNGENFILAVAHRQPRSGGGGFIVDDLAVHVPPFDRRLVIAGFCGTLRGRSLAKVMGDRHSSHWAAAAFARHGVEYEFCDLARSELRRDF